MDAIPQAMTSLAGIVNVPVTARQGLAAATGLRQYMSGRHVLGFQPGGVVIASGSHALTLEFVNGRSVVPTEEGTPASAARGRGASRALGRVAYRDLWEGVTAVYEASDSAVVKSTYFVEAGGAGAGVPVDRIRLRYSVPVRMDAGGDLVMSFATGEMRETRPVAWQEVSGAKVAVEAEYRLLGDREVGFEVGAYDPRYPLVIDPSLIWNTFLGGADADVGQGLTLDASGNAYVTGWSLASWGSPIRPYAGGYEAFVAKLDKKGALQWSTFLGGTNHDWGQGIAVDAGGNVYVVGYSYGAWGSPIRPYSNVDVFVVKLNASGALQWSTFLGGSNGDLGYGIVLDAGGNIYVTGESWSTWDTPLNAHSGNGDALVAKLSTNGALQWHTFFGGSSTDYGYGITKDTGGYFYVTGYSRTTWGSPVNPYVAGSDVFVVKIDANGAPQWNTFVGGSGDDTGYGIAVDSSGNSFLTGLSTATWGSPLRAHSGGYADAFVAKLNASGAPQWNTFLGGSADDRGYAIALDSSGNSYATGFSYSSWGAPVRPFAGGYDAYVVKLDTNGTLKWNTYLGWTGTAGDIGYGIALDPDGNAYVTGETRGTWGTPILPYVASADAFMAKVGRPLHMDLDKDQQEDILWRYYGEGAYQGLNLAWLMSQAGTSTPIPLETAQTSAMADSVLTGSTPEMSPEPPERITIPRAPLKARKRTFKTILNGGRANLPKPGTVMASPTEANTILAGSGPIETASLTLNTETLISVIPDTAWRIAGIGDFNGDGLADILWRYHGTGALQGLNDIWFMNKTTFQSESIMGQVADTAWEIAATGDFNGDGHTDILWRYDGAGTYQGLNVIWYMRSAAFQSEAIFSQITDTSWRIAGTGDFNADGRTDILWRYYGTGAFQGMNVVWYMDGALFQSEEIISQITDTAWEIAGTGDFNYDGKTDILWRYYGLGAYQGMNVLWYMDGVTFLSEEIFGVIPDTNWRIANR